MEQNTTDSVDTLRSLKIDLDRINSDIMPEDWAGHARLAIRQSSVVPKSMEQSAIEKAVAISEQKSIPAERAAKSLISEVADKME